MSTLALDLATVTGFAHGSYSTVDNSGTRTFPRTGEDVGTFLCAFRGWLADYLQRWPDIKRVVYESPILHQTQLNIATMRKLYGLAGVAEMVARDAGKECLEANLTDIRKFFVGVTRAPKDIEQKDRKKWIAQKIIWACHERGWNPKDDNEADALALLAYANACFAPSLSIGGTPLFKERAA